MTREFERIDRALLAAQAHLRDLQEGGVGDLTLTRVREVVAKLSEEWQRARNALEMLETLFPS